MKIVVGLGNPGKKYEQTRHNVGWWVLDHLADVWRFERWRIDGDSLIADGAIADVALRFIKPQTYMNLSGAALRPYARRLAFEGLQQQLLIVVDDVAIPLGTWRLRAAGSPGGHNGLKSIESTLGTQQYARLRVGVLPTGVERPPGDLADFVLGRFEEEEREAVRTLLPDLVRVVESWAKDGVQRAMNVRPTPAPTTRTEAAEDGGASRAARDLSSRDERIP